MSPTQQPSQRQLQLLSPADSIEKFRVERNSFSAEYGQAQGAVINVNGLRNHVINFTIDGTNINDFLLDIYSITIEARGFNTSTFTDPNGTAVPGTTVNVTNQQTSLTDTATTNDEGDYTMPFLLPGRYTVKVETAGFKKAVI